MAAKKIQSKPKAKAKANQKPTASNDLLAQILAAPEDLELRLVYADALIEAGDPRGTFIAQQCALTKLDVLDERYPELVSSTRRLEAAHGAAWVGLAGTRNAVFENGFLHRVALQLDEIEKEWPAHRKREPIYGLEVLVGEGVPEEYHRLKEPKDLTSIKVSPERWFTSNSVGEVLGWGMPNLRSLDLSRCDLGPTGCLLLAKQKEQLGQLILKTCNILDAGALTLFAAPHLAGLKTLDLTQNRLADNGTLEALKKAPAMKRLTRLSLSGNNSLALETLAGWDVLPRLEQLALPQSISGATLGALFPKPSAVLRGLDLRSAKDLGKTPEAIAKVATALTHLDIGGTSVGDAGWKTLLAAPSVRPVMHLLANGCSLSDEAVQTLVTSKLGRIVTLDLSSNKLTDASLEALAEWPGIAQVASFRIGNNKKLSAAGYEALIAAAAFQPAVLDIGKSPAPLVSRLRERFGDVVIAKE